MPDRDGSLYICFYEIQYGKPSGNWHILMGSTNPQLKVQDHSAPKFFGTSGTCV